MARGRNPRGAHTSAPGRISEAATRIAAARLEVMREQGLRILDGAPALQVTGAMGGVDRDERLPAGDLVEAALWLNEGGAGDQAALVLERAAEHQRRHVRAVEEALAAPSRRRSRDLMRAQRRGDRLDKAQRAAVLEDALAWMRMIDQLRADITHLGAGPSIGHARESRHRIAHVRAAQPEISRALIEGDLGFARALAEAIHRDAGNERAAVQVRGFGTPELEIAAALARAERVDAEHGVRAEGHGLLGERSAEENRRERDIGLGPRRIGQVDPDEKGDRSCGHEPVRWLPQGHDRGLLDTLALVCEQCGARVAAVPSHRLPQVSAAHPAPGELLGHVYRSWSDYMQRERRYRALAGLAVPSQALSIEQLRDADGIVDLEEVARSALRRPDRRTGSLAEALAGRRT